MTALKELCKGFIVPQRDKPKEFGGSIPWCRIEDIEGKYLHGTKSGQYVTEETIKNMNLKVIPEGSVICSCSASLGVQAILTTPCITNQTFIGIVPKNELSAEYLYYYLKSRNTYFNKVGTGTTIPYISRKKFEELSIPELSLEEQANIVEILEKTEAIIDQRKQEIDCLDALVKARFVEMFGDPKVNPYDYPIHELSEHIEFLTSGSRGWAKYCVDDGAEWFITIKNVKDCRISTENMQPVNAPDNAEAKRTRVQEGDLLISITADLGRTGVVTKEIADHGAYINQHLTCIRLKQEELVPLYVAYYMDSSAGKEQFASKNQSAVKAGLNFNSINSLKLIVPPKRVQEDFISFVKQVDKSKSVVQKSLDEAQLLFDSLMQQYFG